MPVIVLIGAPPSGPYRYTAPMPETGPSGSTTTMLPFGSTVTRVPKRVLPGGPTMSIWLACAALAMHAKARAVHNSGNTPRPLH
jgi:hypothetical protein